MGSLLPKKLVKKIPSIEVVFNTPIDSRMVYARFYNPIGRGDWYIMGGDQSDTGWLFYGAIIFSKIRLDYFSLEELKNKPLPFGLEILRDESFEAILLNELVQSTGNS